MNPLDFHRLARQLASPADEATCRTAASRSYYGAFLHIRELLSLTGVSFPQSTGSHAQLVRSLKQTADTECRRIGHSLEALRKIRNTADYDVSYTTFSFQKARDAYDRADRIISSFGRLSTRSLQSLTQMAIQVTSKP